MTASYSTLSVCILLSWSEFKAYQCIHVAVSNVMNQLSYSQASLSIWCVQLFIGPSLNASLEF